MDYNRRSSKKDGTRTLAGTFGVLFLGLLAFFAIKGAWGMYGKFASASKADEQVRAELVELQSQYEQIGAAVEAMSSERGVEAGVRERYGVARPGEGQIDIVRRQGSTTPESGEAPGILTKIFRAIFVW